MDYNSSSFSDKKCYTLIQDIYAAHALTLFDIHRYIWVQRMPFYDDFRMTCGLPNKLAYESLDFQFLSIFVLFFLIS